MYDTQWSGGLVQQGKGHSAGEGTAESTRASAGPGAMPLLLDKASGSYPTPFPPGIAEARAFLSL